MAARPTSVMTANAPRASVGHSSRATRPRRCIRASWCNQRVGFEGSVTSNRKDYGITWNAALETGGVLVSDKVTLEFEVSAIKNA
jgi:hypothetical protein